MGWADWMVINQSLEEELDEVERSVREVYNCSDEEALKELCAGLVRQSWHQGKLLSQASPALASLTQNWLAGISRACRSALTCRA